MPHTRIQGNLIQNHFIQLYINKYEEVRTILKGLVNKTLQSKAGIAATISNNSIEKMLSGKAIDKSFDRQAHFLAAVNIEKLFYNAIEPFSFPFDPHKSNENYRAIRRLYTPMAYMGRIIPVKMTVVEMLNEKEGKRIYSLEVIGNLWKPRLGFQRFLGENCEFVNI